MKLRAIKPTLTMLIPMSISFFGPNLSTRGPTIGPSKKPSACDRAKAPEVTARDQPNSLLIGLKKTLKPKKKEPPP